MGSVQTKFPSNEALLRKFVHKHYGISMSDIKNSSIEISDHDVSVSVVLSDGEHKIYQQYDPSTTDFLYSIKIRQSVPSDFDEDLKEEIADYNTSVRVDQALKSQGLY